MYRYFMDKLIRWKSGTNRKPLLIKGVRQCGKTYLIKQFGQEHYEDVAYFSFENNNALMQIFENDFDINRIIEELSVRRNKQINPEKTLIIFDEIQECNKALTSLKYFCENDIRYNIICAGSLLGVALSKPLSFPVGKVDFLNLYPMNFKEFLLASGENMLIDVLDKHSMKEAIPESYTYKLETLLKQYFIVGGMPEAVDIWIKTKDINDVEVVQQNILNSYELDFAKHAPSSDFPKLTAIWRSIPNQLGRENKKFIFSQVKKGWRAKDLEDALEWLIGAGIVYKVAKIEKPGIPLSTYADQTYFKLFMSDIGLLRRMAGLSASSIMDVGDGTYKEFRGAMTENYVLAELINLYEKDMYFWRSGNTAEVDIVFQDDALIIPLEVKSGYNTKSKSLSVYREKYDPKVTLKATSKNTTDNNIPLYLIYKISEKIETMSYEK